MNGLGLTFAFLLLAVAPGAVPPSVPAPPTASGNLSSAGLLEAINAERARAGLGPLSADPSLHAAAHQWAQSAARRKSMAHRKDLTHLIQGSPWSTINENIYMGTGAMTPTRVVRAWMNSPGHRKNLLHPRITVAGIGIATNAQGETYVVYNGAGP